MSTLLAAVGRAQLPSLSTRVAARRRVAARYAERLAGIPGVAMQPEAPWGTHARWLSCITVDPQVAGIDRTAILRAMRDGGAEGRPLWKPMHQQPVYRALGLPILGGAVADGLFADGLCLPSSSSLPDADLDRVCELIAGACASAPGGARR